MALPASFGKLVVNYGPYYNFAGDLTSGEIEFAPDEAAWLKVIDVDAIVVPAPVTGTITNGVGQSTLPLSDDPDVTPSFPYTVTEKITMAPGVVRTRKRTGIGLLTSMLPGPVNLADIAPSGITTVGTTALTKDVADTLYAAKGTGGGTGTVSDATASAAGVVRLSGDLGGTATAPTVAKIKGATISGSPAAGLFLKGLDGSSLIYGNPPADWVNAADYGTLNGANSTLLAVAQANTAALNSAIQACPAGGTVYIPGVGGNQFRLTAPLVAKANITIQFGIGGRYTQYGGMVAHLKPYSGSFVGDALITATEVHGVRLRNLSLNGISQGTVNTTGGMIHGIAAYGSCKGWRLDNVLAEWFSGDGIHMESTTNGWPGGWEVSAVYLNNNRHGFGAFNPAAKSFAFSDCKVVMSEASVNRLDGWHIEGAGNLQMSLLAAAFNTGNGFAFSGGVSNLQLATCQTDRNKGHGYYSSCSEAAGGGAPNPHVITFTGCQASRDGANDEVNRNGGAGFYFDGLSAASPHVPVQLVGCTTHVAKGDSGNGGILCPDYGVKIVNGRAGSNQIGPVYLTACLDTLNDSTGASVLEVAANVHDLVDFTTGAVTHAYKKPNVILSVAGRKGDVVLTPADVGLGNVSNTSDQQKPISAAMQNALNTLNDGFANLGARVQALENGGNMPPVAAFTMVTSNLSLIVDGSGSTDPEGGTLTYTWDYGDGVSAVGVTPPTHVYQAAGTYTVVLTAIDPLGLTGTVSHTVTVTAANQAPTALFTPTVSVMSVSVDASASSDPEGGGLTYSWAWGDGTTTTGVTSQHTYSTAKTYTIKLTVTDPAGLTAVKSIAVTATSPRALVSIGITSTSVADPDVDGVITTTPNFEVSTKNSGPNGRIFWASNDPDTTLTIYAVSDVVGNLGTRRVVATYRLPTALAGNFKEIHRHLGPDGKWYLYLGRTGAVSGSTSQVYRILEPTVSPTQTPVTVDLAASDIVTFTYTSTFSSSAFLVDPIYGDLYLFQKKSGTAPQTGIVTRATGVAAMTTSQTLTFTQVTAALPNVQDSSNTNGIVSASISDDGRYLTVANQLEMWSWNRDPARTIGDTIATALTAPIHTILSSWGTESISYDYGSEPVRIWGLGNGAAASAKYLPVTLGTPAAVTGTPLAVGVYNGGNAFPESKCSIFYFQQNQANLSASQVSSIKALLDAGQTVSMTWTSKTSGQNWPALAYTGDSTVLAWFDSIIASVKSLDQYAVGLNNGSRMLVSVWHEAKVQTVKQGMLGTGQDFGRAQQIFGQRFNLAIGGAATTTATDNRAAHWVLWIAGSDRTFEGAQATECVSPKPWAFTDDPYNNFSTTQTFTSTVTSDLSWLLAQPCYNGRIGITETGMATEQGNAAPYVYPTDAQLAAFYTDMAGKLTALENANPGLQFVNINVFHSDGNGYPHVLAGSTKPNAPFPLAIQALRDSCGVYA